MPSYDKSLTRLILTYPPKQWECGGRSGPRAGIAMSAPWVRDWLIATWKAINVVVTDCKWDNKKLVSWNAAILSFSSNSRYDVGRSWSMDFAEVAHKSCSWIWSSGIAGFVVGAGLGTTAGTISLLGYKPEFRTAIWETKSNQIL